MGLMSKEITLEDFISIASEYVERKRNQTALSAYPKSGIVQPEFSKLFCYRCEMKFPTSDEFRTHFKTTKHDLNIQSLDATTVEKVLVECGQVVLNFGEAKYRIWRCLFHTSSSLRDLTESDAIERLIVHKTSYLLILLFRSGYFAAGIYMLDGSEICHKLFKKYTVRQKQGKSQSSVGGSSSFHSAGSFIRAENEVKLREVYQFHSHF